jgi:hypothetical protein
MGFFSKLFGGGSEQRFEMAPTSRMMDEDLYWKLVGGSLAGTNGEQDASGILA